MQKHNTTPIESDQLLSANVAGVIAGERTERSDLAEAAAELLKAMDNLDRLEFVSYLLSRAAGRRSMSSSELDGLVAEVARAVRNKCSPSTWATIVQPMPAPAQAAR